MFQITENVQTSWFYESIPELYKINLFEHLQLFDKLFIMGYNCIETNV